MKGAAASSSMAWTQVLGIVLVESLIAGSVQPEQYPEEVYKISEVLSTGGIL